MVEFYIHRELSIGDRNFGEAELLQESSVFIILAEPGAGKTELLKYLAELLGTTPIRASIFRNRQDTTAVSALVIDAMDEVSRIDRLAVDEIAVKASERSPRTVIFAGRSSEWDTASTKFIEECFGVEPTVVRLQAFRESEQRQLFEHWFPEENFEKFSNEVERFELKPLLGNPQFLQLLGEAYIEGGRHFTSKAQIFSDAVKRLAHESNQNLGRQNRPPIDALISHAGEIFAKLMLSGATGVSSIQKLSDLDFPYVRSLSNGDAELLKRMLDSRLFKPSVDADHNEPVHRIVAEYCAARYLVQRIDDSGDLLSLSRILSIIAPNGVVRDELRGMIGWMAALGGPAIQKAAIEIDPYAVLANGDPSQLSASSKRFLLDRLQALAKQDPYFRRSDVWRTFNVGKFFSIDIVENLRPLLAASSQERTLRDLVLELLPGTEAAGALVSELQAVTLNSTAGEHARLLALRVLLPIPSYEGASNLATLIAEGTLASLRLAARIVSEYGAERCGLSTVISLLNQLAGLYPTDPHHRDRELASRYFIKQLVKTFSLNDVVYFLGNLTTEIECTCRKPEHQCRCRLGISKIAGSLLDRYFEISEGSHQPAQIWSWARRLRFGATGVPKESFSIKALQENLELRQAVQRLAIGEAIGLAQVRETVFRFHYSTTHAGLRFHQEDIVSLVNYAYETENFDLWTSLWVSHNLYSETKGKNELRSRMRAQSRSRLELARIWARQERDWKRMVRQSGERWWNRSRRYARREELVKEKNFAHLQANRPRIESGSHWGWLRVFAECYLLEPSKMGEIVDDIKTAESALRNCLPFLMEHMPSVEGLSRREGTLIAHVGHAACLLHFRETETLEHIDPLILRAVKTDVGGYPAYAEGELEAFEEELDRLLFSAPGSAEAFVREYIETRLSSLVDEPTDVGWLDYRTAFQPFRETLPLEWLKRFPAMPMQATQSLFGMAAKHGNRQELMLLIAQRSKELLVVPEADQPDNSTGKERRKFWLLNSFFFNQSVDSDVWNVLKADPSTLFAIEHRAGRFSSADDDSRPPLSAEKIFVVLDTYIDAWPRVHLPSAYGTGDPPAETAYRFLSDIVGRIANDLPDRSLPVLERMLADSRFADFRDVLLTMKAASARKLALQDFRAPSHVSVAALLNNNGIASVEDLRAFMLDELGNLQVWVQGAETDPIETFYPAGKRVDENTGRNRIVDRLQGRMTALSMSVVVEHQLADENRCDFTASSMIAGARRLLTVEVKGQWHKELYTAAAEQLDARYAIHPDAARQGIYLVLWFGPEEKIAGVKNKDIKTPAQLRNTILGRMPAELHAFIDVFVLDLSRKETTKRVGRTKKAVAAV